MRLAKAEDQFQDRELLYRDLLNALPVAVYTTDAEGRITFYNEAAVAFSGRRPELGSDSWCVTWRLYNADGSPLPHDQCPMAVAVNEGRAIRGVEAIAERPDGSRLHFIPYPTPLKDAQGRIVGAVNMLVDISERKAAEERQRLLAHEVNHRANNLLAVAQGLVRLTQAGDVTTFRASLDGRIQALARTHGLLAKSHWAGVDLQQMIFQELAPYLGGPSPRAWISGAPLPMGAAAAQSMAMILHELAANALKHGALATEMGEVRIEWRQDGDQLVFRWSERGGASPEPDARPGVGLGIVERAAASFWAKVEFSCPPEGLCFELRARTRDLVAAMA